MHEMWSVGSVVPQSHSVCPQLCCAKMAEQVNVLFAVETLGDPRNIVLDRSPDYHMHLIWPLPLL